MKFAYKIFCLTYIIVMLAAGIGGFLLVEVTSSSVINSKKDSVIMVNRYAAEMFATHLDSDVQIDAHIKEIERDIYKTFGEANSQSFSIYKNSEAKKHFEQAKFISQLNNSQQGCALINQNNTQSLLAVCRIDYGLNKYYIATVSSFSDVLSQKSNLVTVYRYAVLATALFAGIILLIFSVHMSRPLKNLSSMAGEISKGNYNIRIKKSRHSSKEIKDLTDNFNTMAQAVQTNINELNDEMQRRDIFVADFTHELKTPMTSIIGYADMLRSFSLSPGETRDTADTIYKESKRLGELSMRLLDIIVLKNEDIKLSKVNANELFSDYEKAVYFLQEKYDVDVEIEYQNAVLLCEKELLLSLMYNLTDNAGKASYVGGKIMVSGNKTEKGYTISVRDFGKGISKENINKITEPFFMEDKSRSRKQGGAGLGLSLCNQIATLHDSRLIIESEKDKGTMVSFLIKTDDSAGDYNE